MDVSSLHTELPAGAGVPDYVHLVPAGVFSGVDGRGPYELADAAALIRTFEADGKLVLDENHSTDHAMRSGGSAPAVGWIVELQNRTDGIWGKVDWTAPGQRLMQDRAYRGLSPAFVAQDGKVTRLVRASLTNAPNLTLTHLHAQEPRMDLARVRTLLGLPDAATEADVERALTAARGTVDLHSRVAEIAGVEPRVGQQELVTALRAKVSTASTNDQRVVELQTQIDTMRAEGQRRDAEAVVDGAIRDGRAIDENLRKDLITLHATQPDAVGRIIASVPNLKRTLHVSTGLTSPKASGDDASVVGGLLGVDAAKIRDKVGSAA